VLQERTAHNPILKFLPGISMPGSSGSSASPPSSPPSCSPASSCLSRFSTAYRGIYLELDIRDLLQQFTEGILKYLRGGGCRRIAARAARGAERKGIHFRVNSRDNYIIVRRIRHSQQKGSLTAPPRLEYIRMNSRDNFRNPHHTAPMGDPYVPPPPCSSSYRATRSAARASITYVGILKDQQQGFT